MTRLLTQVEIDNILDFIKPRKGIPVDSAELIAKNTKKTFEKQLKNQQVYPEIIPELKQQLEKIYNKSLIPAGESVGVICAQSIGERNTQTTLNSVDYYDKILYMKDNQIFVKNIGEFIDDLLFFNGEKIIIYPKNNTQYLDIESGYYIPSVDENGFMHWKSIKAITKHLPNGQLVKVTTESGRIVSASQSKSFLVWNGNKFVDTLGSEIKLGDILPTTKKIYRFGEMNEYFDNFKLDYDFGFFIGLYITDGLIIDNFISFLNKNINIREKLKNWCEKNEVIPKFSHYDIKLYSDKLIEFLKKYCENDSNYKMIPLFSYTSSNDFIKGLIDGYYSNNSYIDNNEIVVSSSSENNINSISFLLNYFGIFTKIVRYNNYITLNIPNDFIKMFVETFSITDDNKRIQFNQIKQNIEIENTRNVYFDKIKTIEYVEATNGFVYDLTVEDTYTFALFNGLNMMDKNNVQNR